MAAALAAEQERQLGISVASQMVINPAIPLLQQMPGLNAVVVQAVQQAIKDIVSPVVERSVTIACITTREMVLKDFTLDPDDAQLRSAANMMVQNLAGSLALVTCREPLRHSMCNQLRASLTKAGAGDAASVEQTAQVVAADNLDLGCSLIEKAATDKALADVDAVMDVALKQRRVPGTPQYEAQVEVQTWLRYLPETLR
eukprot:CAMPEP_0180149596 /NCGR_PEP_ID=MMETSP0986-20121125/20901_1 /TAXON_ID=697907 /ORGANISM="non described non described, Strain CCMP2293" /LENGTH=199 /DNA_ID=CAMNT_0022096277 /DNA_START=20 /DNA_END=616 /DNA_ORIENTATION=-